MDVSSAVLDSTTARVESTAEIAIALPVADSDEVTVVTGAELVSVVVTMTVTIPSAPVLVAEVSEVAVEVDSRVGGRGCLCDCRLESVVEEELVNVEELVVEVESVEENQ